MKTESANIITRREYPDGSIIVEINGREIPDVRLAVKDQASGDIYMRIGCGQFNAVQGDAPTPANSVEVTFIDMPAKPQHWLQRMFRR